MEKTSKRILGKNSALTIGTSLATALAAITTSIIASKLAGVLNSILLAGVISVVSAVISEIYKNMVSQTTEKAKVILSDHTAVGLDTSTTESEVDQLKAPSEIVEDRHGPPGKEEPEKGLPEKDLLAQQGSEKPSVLHRIQHYLKHNRFMQLALLFSAVVIMTSLIHLWFFPDSAKNYYYNTTVEKVTEVTEQVDPADPNSATPLPNGTATENPNSEQATEESATATPTPNPSSSPTDSTVDTLRTDVEALRAENEDLKQRLAEQESLYNQLTDRLAALEAQLSRLPTTG